MSCQAVKSVPLDNPVQGVTGSFLKQQQASKQYQKLKFR